MGFEDYQVTLHPQPNTRLSSGGTPELTVTLACEIQQTWSAFAPDDVERAYEERAARPGDVFLAYETAHELFQLKLSLDAGRGSGVTFSLRFAYCNPRSVYEPFCQVITALMSRYELICHPAPDFAPSDAGQPADITLPSDVRRLLTPSMDYNRRFWFLDAGTDEEAPLRPGDAIARFIMPRLTPLPAQYAETF